MAEETSWLSDLASKAGMLGSFAANFMLNVVGAGGAVSANDGDLGKTLAPVAGAAGHVLSAVGTGLGWLSDKDPSKFMLPNRAIQGLREQLDPSTKGDEWDKGYIGQLGDVFDKGERLLTTGFLGMDTYAPGTGRLNLGAQKTMSLTEGYSKAWNMAFDKNSTLDVGAAILAPVDFLTDPNGLANLHKGLDSTPGGNAAAGALTFMSFSVIDPTRGLGKVAKASRAASYVTDAEHADRLATTINAAEGVLPKAGNVGNTARKLAGQPLDETDQAGYFLRSMGSWNGITDPLHIVDKITPMLGDGVNGARAAIPGIAEMMADAGHIADSVLQAQVHANILLAAGRSGESMKWLADNYPSIAAKGRRLSTTPDEFSLLHDVMDDVSANGIANLDMGKWVDSHYGSAPNQAELKTYAAKVQEVRDFRQSIEHGGEGATPVEFGTSGKGTLVKPRTLELLKAGLNQHLTRSYLLQDGTLGRTMNIVDRPLNSLMTARAARSVSIDDPLAGNRQILDTMRRFNDKLKTVDGPDIITPEEIRATSEAYLKATPIARGSIVDALGNRLIELVAKKYSPESMAERGMALTAEDVQAMIKMDNATISNGRAYFMNKAATAKAAGEKETYLGDLGGADTVYPTAYLSSQLESNRFLWDWESANRAVDSHYLNARMANGARVMVKTGIGPMERLGQSGVVQAISRAQMIWRHGVLIRPGLAPRAIMDTGARATITNGVMTTAYQAKLGAENFARNHGGGLLGGNAPRMEMSFGDILGSEGATATIDALKAEGADQAVNILGRSLQNTQATELTKSLAYKVQHGPGTRPGQFHSLSKYYAGLAERAGNLALRQRNAATTVGGEQTLGIKALTDEFNVDAAVRKESIAGLEKAKGRYEAGQPLTKHTLASTPFTEGGYTWQAVKNDMEAARLNADMTAGGQVSDVYGLEVSNRLAGYRADLTHGSQNIAANDPAWAPKFTLIANEQLDSYTARRMLTERESMAAPARTPEVVVRSFLSDPQARAEYLKVSGERRVDTEDMRGWLTTVHDRLEGAVPTEQARELLRSGKKITPEMASTIQGTDRFPIYGPDILRTDESATKKAIDKFYNLALNMPDMNLARAPMFNGLYHANIAEILPSYVAKATAEGRTQLTTKEMYEVHNSARGRALNDTRRDMYDVNRQVGAQGVTKMISPFFGAWEDAMMSWSRLLYDDPARIGSLMRASQTPDMFGVTTKQDGTPVRPFDGTALQDKYVTIPLFGLGGLEGFRANMGSFNSIQQGNVPFSPGVGPTVQLSASALVAGALPHLGEPGQWLWKAIAENPDNIVNKSIFPQGGIPKADATTLALSVLPSWGRKFIDAVGGTQDEAFGGSYASAFAVRYNDLIIQYRTSNGGADPSPKELRAMQGQATSGALAAGIASAATTWGFGVSGNAAPEGQFYMDKMHVLNQMAPALAAQGLTAAGVFAQQYPQAARLNWSLSVNEGRLEATVNATSAYQKNRNLMDRNKESAWWIAGQDNIMGTLGNPDAAGNTFSSSAYNQQMTDGLRRRYTKDELANQTDIAMGFGRMGEFDAALNLYMRQNNIKSLNAKNAGQLGMMKQNYTAELRTQFPGWAESVDTLDKGRTTRQFEQITALVSDPPPSLANRPDVVTTGKYLFARKALADFAAESGVTKWQTSKQFLGDRYALWQYGQTLAAGDIVFQRGWSRLFETEFKKDLEPQVGN